jgi:ADP-heptose:LPS heptosyltransferase
MLELSVPPGIGDISWVYSKVADLAKEREIGFRICSNPPKRSSDYVDLLPNIKNLGYTGGHFPDIKGRLLTKEENIADLPDGQYAVFLNNMLEQGAKLADIFPSMPTKYHYEMNVPDRCKIAAAEYLSSMDGTPKIGFYASSNAHRSEFQFWTPGEWAIFVGTVASMYPKASLIAIGASYDDRSYETYGVLKHNGANVTSVLGQTDIGTTLEIIRGLDFFFAFPSGLGILADVIDTPCQMWYWPGKITERFINSYADPKNVESGRHANLFYCSMSDSLNFFMKNGMKWI